MEIVNLVIIQVNQDWLTVVTASAVGLRAKSD
jgi:hypothetical protein